MSPKDPDIVVLSSKPSLGPAGTNPFWAVLSCQKKKTTPFQLDLESQKKLLRHYSYDVVAGARRHRLQTMGSEPSGLCLSRVTRGGRGTAGVSCFPMKAVPP